MNERLTDPNTPTIYCVECPNPATYATLLPGRIEPSCTNHRVPGVPNIALTALLDSPSRALNSLHGAGNRFTAHELATFIWQHTRNPKVKEVARRFNYVPYHDGKGKRRERGDSV